jgi:hypothetical protein
MRHKKVIQLIYVKINPKTDKVQTSCTMMPGSQAIYVANYHGTQDQLRLDYEKLQEDE